MNGQAQVAPISERRGAVIAGALICAVLLALGYGAGIGVVSPDVGDGPDGGANGGGDGEAVTGEGEGLGDGGSSGVAPTAPAGGRGAASLRGGSPPAGAGPTSRTSPGIVAAAREVLPSILPTPSIVAPSTTLPPQTPPPQTPPTSSLGRTPPPSTPVGCTGLVSSLLRGLVGHLAGPDVNAVLVQQVSDVLGLEELLPSDSLLGDVVTPLFDSTLAPLGSALSSDSSVAPAMIADAGLIPDLRGLLGVDVTGVVTVTAGQLSALLDAVLGGC